MGGEPWLGTVPWMLRCCGAVGDVAAGRLLYGMRVWKRLVRRLGEVGGAAEQRTGQDGTGGTGGRWMTDAVAEFVRWWW